jgi:hypothetical protein
VTFSPVPDLVGEDWKLLPSVADVPLYIWERRIDSQRRPEKKWGKTLVSNKGRVKIDGLRVTYGFEAEEYLAVKIDGMKFYVQVLCALAFKLSEFKHNYQVDHDDEDKHNNKLENLIPRDPKDHNHKTRRDNPNMATTAGKTISKMLKLVESPRLELIGQVKFASEWAEELGIPRYMISCSVQMKCRADKKHRFEVVIDELLVGEDEITHSVYVDNQLISYKVSTFGRYWSRDRWHVCERVELSGFKWYIHQLVLLAKTQLTRIPTDEYGISKTVDHINGREGEWPHRMTNLRWCSAAEQCQNRDCK